MVNKSENAKTTIHFFIQYVSSSILNSNLLCTTLLHSSPDIDEIQ